MKDKYENASLQNWEQYSRLKGKLTFEEFYSHPLNTQKMLIRLRTWQRKQGIRDTIKGSE